VLRDQLADECVVVAKHFEQLFGSRGLCEGREAAQVAEENGDVGAVTGQKPFAVLAGQQLRDARRNETRQLRPLSFHRVEQPRVRDRDRRLIGERPHELDVLVGERLRFDAHDVQRADQLAVDNDRNTE